MWCLPASPPDAQPLGRSHGEETLEGFEPWDQGQDLFHEVEQRLNAVFGRPEQQDAAMSPRWVTADVPKSLVSGNEELLVVLYGFPQGRVLPTPFALFQDSAAGIALLP